MGVVEAIISAVTVRHLRPLAMGSIAAAAFLSGGCTDRRGGAIPYDVVNFGVPDSPAVAALGTDYKIAPMDTLTVTIFRVPELTGDYQVDLMGHISMPLVGAVPAADMKPEELDRILTDKLAEKYFENPDVTVGIKASAGRAVTVDGAVHKAGSYPVRGPLTLMQAVALAGGAEEDANLRRVAVFRTIGGQRQAAAFDLVSIRQGGSADPQLYAGDIIYVDGSSVKNAQKQILKSIPLYRIFRPFIF